MFTALEGEERREGWDHPGPPVGRVGEAETQHLHDRRPHSHVVFTLRITPRGCRDRLEERH